MEIFLEARKWVKSMALLAFHKYPLSQSAHPPKAGLSRLNEVHKKQTKSEQEEERDEV
jgi:hypothetical protein